MKMNGLFTLGSSTNARVTLFQKVLFVSLIIALLVASFSVSSVLAAKSNPQHEQLELAWSKKVAMLRAEVALSNRILLTPSQIEGCSKSEQATIMAGNVNTAPDGQQVQAGTGNISRASCFFKWQHAQNRLERYRLLLRQAQTLLVNSGFDANGVVIDEKQARLSIDTLGTYLSTMRNIRLSMSVVK